MDNRFGGHLGLLSKSIVATSGRQLNQGHWVRALARKPAEPPVQSWVVQTINMQLLHVSMSRIRDSLSTA